MVGLQALQGRLDGRANVAFRQALSIRRHLGADLGGDHELVAIAAGLHPFADDRFRLAAYMAGHPGGIDIRRVDEVEARIHIGVEHLEGGCLIGGPAEDIAAEAERRNHQVGAAKPAFFHHHIPVRGLIGGQGN